MTASLLPPVRERGSDPAVSVAGEGLTYAELREAAAALAGELLDLVREAYSSEEFRRTVADWGRPR